MVAGIRLMPAIAKRQVDTFARIARLLAGLNKPELHSLCRNGGNFLKVKPVRLSAFFRDSKPVTVLPLTTGR
jgi:hypothetical protein